MGLTERADDFYQAALSTIRIAADRQVDCVAACGDLLNEGRNLPGPFGHLRQIHEYGQKVGIPIFCCLGNHDDAKPSWYDQVQTGGTGALNEQDGWVQVSDGIMDLTNRRVQFRGTVFAGLPPVLDLEVMSIQASRLAKGLRPNQDVVWLWHGAVRDFISFPSDRYPTCQDIQTMLATIPVRSRAFLMGDLHIEPTYTHLPLQTGPCLIGYPGATELLRRSEPLTHSCTLVDLDDLTEEQVPKLETIPTRHRPVVAFRLTQVSQLPALVGMVEELAGQKPIVLVRYCSTDPELERSLNRALDPKSCILRAEPLEREGRIGWDALRGGAEQARERFRLDLPTVLKKFVVPTDPLYDLGVALCADSGGTKDEELIDQYCREALS